MSSQLICALNALALEDPSARLQRIKCKYASLGFSTWQSVWSYPAYMDVVENGLEVRTI